MENDYVSVKGIKDTAVGCFHCKNTLTLAAVLSPTDRFPTVDSLTRSAGDGALSLSPDAKRCVGELFVLYAVVVAYCHTEMRTAVLHQEEVPRGFWPHHTAHLKPFLLWLFFCFLRV